MGKAPVLLPPTSPAAHLSMRTSRMTRTSKSRQETTGIKTVWIQNQCSGSSAMPGKIQGDMDPQPVHHHNSELGTPVALCGWPWELGIIPGRAQLGPEDGEGAHPQALPCCHHNRLVTPSWTGHARAALQG